MLSLWFTPLTIKERRRTEYICEILLAWEYSRVFLFAMFILVWQTEMVTASWISGLCSPLEKYFRSLTYYGVLAPEDGQCYTRIARVGPAQFIFLVQTVLLEILITFVTMASNQYKKESEGSFYYRNKKDETEVGSNDSDREISPKEETDDGEEIKQFPAQFTDTFPFLFNVESYCNTRDI